MKLMLNFKIKEAKIRRNKNKIIVKSINTKEVNGFCVLDNGEFKMQVAFGDPIEILHLPLTSKSFDLKGRNIVFNKRLALKGKAYCIIKNEHDCKYFPADGNAYISVCPNRRFLGNIVKINGKLYFDLISYIQQQQITK